MTSLCLIALTHRHGMITTTCFQMKAVRITVQKNTDVTQCKRTYKQNAIKKKILKPVKVSTSNYPANVVPQANLQIQ